MLEQLEEGAAPSQVGGYSLVGLSSLLGYGGEGDGCLGKPPGSCPEVTLPSAPVAFRTRATR